MLINCKPGCAGKKVTTNGSLDLEQDEIVCTFCDEIIPASRFIKVSMKNQGDIIRRDTRKPFQYNCLTCKKKVQTTTRDNKLVGIDCEKDCSFNVSKFTVHAMSNIISVSQNNSDEQSEEVEGSD